MFKENVMCIFYKSMIILLFDQNGQIIQKQTCPELIPFKKKNKKLFN